MNKFMSATIALALAVPLGVVATPQEDLDTFRAYFEQRFPNTSMDDYVNGIYSIDPTSREEWVAIEEFAPYELNIDNGKALFETPFTNGKSLADCFPNEGIGVRQNYPHYDLERKEVVTLELAINECREANGEKPYKYSKGPIADVSAYMAYTSRGEKIEVEIPNDDALAWYERGRRHFYAKRGQLNLSCADCHVYNAGMYVRADKLSPALGHSSHFPVFRSKWGELGTLHRRYKGCNEQVRAKPFKPQGEEYRALEYFHTYMSNGLEINGPGARK